VTEPQVIRGRLEAVQLLLEAGADPDLPRSDGDTPLMLAAGHGRLEALRLLLARGAAVDAVDVATGGTAFHLACAQNQPDCAEALVQAGCSLVTGDGETGWDIAQQLGHTAVVERLRALDDAHNATLAPVELPGGGAAAGAKKKRKKRPKKKRAAGQPGGTEPEIQPEPELAQPAPDQDPLPGVLAALGLSEHLLACREHEMDLGAPPPPRRHALTLAFGFCCCVCFCVH
jgi:hypothetical protein